jgi:hypothetical protein
MLSEKIMLSSWLTLFAELTCDGDCEFQQKRLISQNVQKPQLSLKAYRVSILEKEGQTR